MVIAFSGHGSVLHQLVTYDAELADLAGSTISLGELTRLFAAIPARKLVCILDCCFSGGMGAKVLRIEAKPRTLKSTAALLDELAGDGRLILTASAADEEAWESERVGHGLLTYHLLEALQGAEEVRDSGRLPVLRLLEHVTRRVRDAARALGAEQNPGLRGTIDGEFVWPVFRRGDRYLRAFPEQAHPPATEEVASLASFGFQEELLAAWSAAIPALNELQLAAINSFDLLDGADLVVSAPTSTGKTMVGELSALKGVCEHRRALFLLPARALVNDKHEQFRRTYGPVGLRTIRATGEFDEDLGDLLQGHYDVCLMTFEKAAGLLLAYPHLLRQVGTIVVDEAQMIVDPGRGVNLEFLLTLLKVRRRQGIAPQIVALSAVIGDTNGLERWLGARLLRREQRPVPLRESILTRSGHVRYLASEGEVHEQPLIDPAWGTGSRVWLIPLVRRLTDEGKKVIVFRETKPETIACAVYLSQALALPPADAALDALPSADPSVTTGTLRQVLAGGVAFHNADLDRDEKLVLEQQFRDHDSPLRVIVATTTLAMGVNTPASAVAIVGLTHPGGVPYSVAEYKNMIGRAGRLGFNEEGESYIVPPDPPEYEAWSRYVLGRPEDLRSQLVGQGSDSRSLILRVLASSGESGLSRADVVAFLEESFAAHQERAHSSSWRWDEPALQRAFDELERHELIAAEGTIYRPTELGMLAGQNGVEVESMLRLVALLRPLNPDRLNDAALIAAAQVTVELDDVLFPFNKRSKHKEPAHWPAVLARAGVPQGMLGSLSVGAGDLFTVIRRWKRGVACLLWMSSEPRVTIERVMTQFSPSHAAAGPIQASASRTCDLLPVVTRTVELLHPEADLGERGEELRACLELGLPRELAPVARAGGRSLSRGDYLQLLGAGLYLLADVRDADTDKLAEILGSPARAAELQRAVGRQLDEEAERAALAAALARLESDAA